MRAAGAAVGETLDRVLVEELEGMAAGAAQDVRDLLAINARTELLAGAECSVLGRLDGAEVTLAQTWDWHPDLAPSRVLWTVHHGDGAWFTTATEAGVLAKLGLNHHGVACALNLLTCSADGGIGGVPIHILLRLVLERGEDAEHAAELLCAARATASSAITLASPGEPARRRALARRRHRAAPGRRRLADPHEPLPRATRGGRGRGRGGHAPAPRPAARARAGRHGAGGGAHQPPPRGAARLPSR